MWVFRKCFLFLSAQLNDRGGTEEGVSGQWDPFAHGCKIQPALDWQSPLPLCGMVLIQGTGHPFLVSIQRYLI